MIALLPSLILFLVSHFLFRRYVYHATVSMQQCPQRTDRPFHIYGSIWSYDIFLLKIQQPINFAPLEQPAPCAAQQIFFPLVIIGK